jgi:hypothetical protein
MKDKEVMTKKFNPCVDCGDTHIRQLMTNCSRKFWGLGATCENCNHVVHTFVKLRKERHIKFAVRHSYIIKRWNKINPLPDHAEVVK